MRLFFAIPVPQEFQKAIQKIQKELLSYKDPMTWVKPEQCHITLRFLGNQPEEKLSAIINCSGDIFSRIPQFVLGDSALKVFPDAKYPRVLLVDFKKGVNEFLVLQRKIDEALLANGLVFKNPKVRPHLTVGRIKEKTLPGERQALVLRLSEAIGKPPRLPAGKAGFTKVDLVVKVQEIHLIQSQLTPQGPIYTKLESFSLVNA